MERLFMGPGRDDDGDADISVDAAAERVELGDRSRSGEQPEQGMSVVDAEPGEHWLAGLVRADVLALTGAGVVLLTAVGLPFLGMIQNMMLYIGPLRDLGFGMAWSFVPFLVAGGVAMLLGLAGLRQAGRHGGPGWVRAVAGVAVLLGLLIAAGSAVTWLYAADAAVFDQGPQF